MLEGVTARESTNQKDEIVIEGNDIEKVSQSAASIHGSCLVKNKDVRCSQPTLCYWLCADVVTAGSHTQIRKFLDVSLPLFAVLSLSSGILISLILRRIGYLRL